MPDTISGKPNPAAGKLTRAPSVLSPASDADINIISDLRTLGFGEYEARAYIGLLKCGPATAYEVAKVSDLPRANVYSILKSLAKKGAAQPVNEKPLRYMPISPEEVFKRITENTSRLCADMVERLSSIKDNDGREYVWIFKGKVEILRKISEMIKAAKEHVWLKGTAASLQPLLPEIKKAAWRGISVVIVVFSDSVEPFQCGGNCQVFLHEANGVILGGADNFLTVTTDSNKALIAKVKGELEAAYSENYPFVYMVDVMIKHEIYLAEIMNRFGDEIEKEFGAGLIALREIYNPTPPGEQFENYVRQRLSELNNKH